MPNTSFVPRLKADRRVWLSNFVAKLQDAATGYATKYNIDAGTITTLAEGRQWVEWTFNNLDALRDKTQSLTLFQDQLMSGKGAAAGDLPIPEALVYTAVPANGAVTIVPTADVIGLAAGVGKQIKNKANYSLVDGQDLGLEGPEQPPLPSPATTAPDLAKSRMASAGQVEVVWKKGPFDAIKIEVDRSGGGSGSGWTLLAVDTEPNYIDTVMPPPGTLAVYRYRAIFLLGDAPYGQWSQPAEVTVRG